MILLMRKGPTRPQSAPVIKFVSLIFLHFRVLLDFLTHLAKFQSIMNIRSHFVLTFNSENLRPPLINLVPSLGCKWEKVTSKAQKYLTGWNENNKCSKSREKEQKLWTCSSCNFLCWLLLKFQPVRYVWAFDVTFPNSQPNLGTGFCNGGRKFSELKVKIKWLVMFVMDWNLARWIRTSSCTRTCKKIQIENLITGAL